MTPYLYAHPNRFAPVRANGVRFWGYPSRRQQVRVICIHTAENVPDYIGRDGGAEAVAAFQSRTDRPSSYHEIVDSDSHVVCLPPHAVAFGAKGANTVGWHLSFATKAHLWPDKPKRWRDAALNRGAERARAAADLFDVPVRRITREQYLAGWSGFVAHADVDPDRRSDPGDHFPWDHFLHLIATPEDDMPSLEDVRAVVNAEHATTRQMVTQARDRTNEAIRLSEAVLQDAFARERHGMGLKPDPVQDAAYVADVRHERDTYAGVLAKLRKQAER